MLTVHRFESQHIADAARLFADAYSRQRELDALLPQRFCDPSSVEPLIENVAKEHPGAIVLDGQRIAGYLIGFSSIPTFFGRSPGVYVPVYGHCVAPTHEIEPVFSALYGRMAAEWAEQGCVGHALTYFVDGGDKAKALESQLFGFGFGMQVIDAIRPLSADDMAVPDNLMIMSAEPGDEEAVRALDQSLGDHLRSAPIFLHTSPVSEQDTYDNFFRDGVKTLIAWRDGVPVAGIRGVLNYGPGCQLFNIEGSLGINFAYTGEGARRSGVATHLLNALLQWGAEQDMKRCVVDFEAANLLARGFWQRHFRVVCHSAVRKVDDRMVSISQRDA